MHLHIDWILLPVLLLVMSALLFLLRRTRVGPLLHEHIAKRPQAVYRLRQLLSDLRHCAGYGLLHRAPDSAFSLRDHARSPYSSPGVRNPDPAWGGLRLAVRVGQRKRFFFRLCQQPQSLLYGLGAALTLDEFALWLNLKDVYFVREGRSSIDAVVLFGSLLAISAWGAPLFAALACGKTRPTVPDRRP